MDGAWFLEAWDRMGGRGLASRRAERPAAPASNVGMSTLGGSPTIYVGPPGFEPELVTKASLALSAGRSGYFEQRVPAEGPEAGFPSAQAVAEFVRRGFVAGGSTRGGGEGGGAPVPEGEPPAEPDAPGGSVQWLAEYCSTFAFGVSRLTLSETASSVLPRLRVDTKEPMAPETDPVAWGAVELLVTMLAAYPKSWTDMSAGRWERAAASLAFALHELDLWRVLATPTKRYGPTSYLEQAVSKFWRDHAAPAEQVPEFDSERVAAIARLVLHGHRFDAGAVSVDHERIANRFEPLFSWPLPARTADELKNKVSGSGVPSVGQLLSLFVASPGEFKSTAPSVFRIISFAAAFLSSSLTDRPSSDGRVHAAHAWLTRSLPQWLFEARLEREIAQTARSHGIESAERVLTGGYP